MENGPPTIGFEDGTIDVERLLVEPQDGHVSVDSVLCFNEKIPDNSMGVEDVSRSFGVSNTSIAQRGEELLNRDVLDSMHSEVEVGYFRLQNDFCSMGEEYLLGVEFAESITNLDYGSSEALQTSVSDNPILASTADISMPWKEDLLTIMELPKCQNNQLNISASTFVEIPNHCHEPLKSPTSCTLRDIDKFHDISSCSFQDILSDENDTSLSPSVEMLCSPKNEKINESVLTGQNETKRFHGQDAIVTTSAQTSCVDSVPTQKRSRKPTQRYIDELADPILRPPKKKREASSSTIKDKYQGVKDHKKCNAGSKTMKLPAEESSVKAIQVPFASLVHKECPRSPTHDMVRRSDRGHLMSKPKDSLVTPENLKRYEFPTVIHQKKRDHSERAASQKKRDETYNAAYFKKTDDRLTAPSQKKRNDFILAVSPKKQDDCLTAIRQKKRDEYFTEEIPEEINGRRKHHRLWTIAEVRKLIDGVSEYGVGRWSRIKKLFFSSSTHRTSVDLKDKWRNLLKASGIQGQSNRQGEKKRNLAWRPLPKSILRRVCELASMYPYPKGRKLKIPRINHDSPDRSTDITLSDYRRILRSINGN